MEKLRPKKWDIIIIAVVLCAAALTLVMINAFNGDGAYAVVEVDGDEIVSLSLNEDTIYDIEIDGRVTNTLEIKDGFAKITSADCPDKICVHHRKISKNSESIVCLPNKVIITISGGDESEADGVAR